MSSTPRSNAASFIFRSPRRVRPRTGVVTRVRPFAAPICPSRRCCVVVHVDHRQVGGPLGQDRLRLGQGARGPDGEHAVVEREGDEVHTSGRSWSTSARRASSVGFALPAVTPGPSLRW